MSNTTKAVITTLSVLLLIVIFFAKKQNDIMSDMSYNCQTVHDLGNEVANSVQDAIQCKSDCDDKDIKAYKNLDKWFYLMEHLHSED